MQNSIEILVRDTVRAEFETFFSLELLESISQKILAEADVSGQEVSVVMTDDEEMLELNSNYRGKKRTTDVLSFASLDGEAIPSQESLLGDVVISIPMVRIQAHEQSVSLQEELTRLMIHGILHLLGFDHEVDESEAAKMRQEEERILENVRPLLAQ